MTTARIATAARRLLAGLVAWAAAAAAMAGGAAPFDLQGHRGARGLAPENTLAGFERTLELGVTTLELDVVVTRDGVAVVHHDLTLSPDLTRDAQGRWLEQRGPAIHSLTFAELQAYDVGRLKPDTAYAKRYPEQQAIDGQRIPRLSELFALVRRRGDERVRFAIETKLNPDLPEQSPAPEAFAALVVDEVRRAGMAARTQILSFDWRTLQAVQRIAPEIATVYLSAQQRWLDNIGAGSAEGSRWTAGFQWREHGSIPKMIKAAGGTHWSVFHGDLSAPLVQEARSLGLKVLVWTVNDVPTMGRMIDLGVDGLITDRPDLAARLLEQRGIRWR